MLKNSFFITGTDTNIGKTEITCGFIQFFKNKEKIVFGMKPVAAGTDYINHQKINEDVHKFKTLNSQNKSIEITKVNRPDLLTDKKKEQEDK